VHNGIIENYAQIKKELQEAGVRSCKPNRYRSDRSSF